MFCFLLCCEGCMQEKRCPSKWQHVITCPISVRVPLQVFLCVSLTTRCQLPCAGAVGTSSESNKMHKMKTWLGPVWKMELVFQFNRLKKPGRFCAQLTLNGSCSSPYLFPMVWRRDRVMLVFFFFEAFHPVVTWAAWAEVERGWALHGITDESGAPIDELPSKYPVTFVFKDSHASHSFLKLTEFDIDQKCNIPRYGGPRSGTTRIASSKCAWLGMAVRKRECFWLCRKTTRLSGKCKRRSKLKDYKAHFRSDRNVTKPFECFAWQSFANNRWKDGSHGKWHKTIQNLWHLHDFVRCMPLTVKRLNWTFWKVFW